MRGGGKIRCQRCKVSNSRQKKNDKLKAADIKSSRQKDRRSTQLEEELEEQAQHQAVASGTEIKRKQDMPKGHRENEQTEKTDTAIKKSENRSDEVL
eukprot:2008567-Pleurochrysis_carterae.AAC.4